MSTLALIEVQKALYAKLSADGVLTGMVNGIFDAVPQKTVLPYIVIGDGIQQVLAADGLEVTECRLELHAWSESAGRKKVLTMLNRVYALLHLGTLTVSGFQVTVLRAERASVRVVEAGTHVTGSLSVLITVVEV